MILLVFFLLWVGALVYGAIEIDLDNWGGATLFVCATSPIAGVLTESSFGYAFGTGLGMIIAIIVAIVAGLMHKGRGVEF